MNITLTSVSKVFGREAVIWEADHVFEAGSRTAILGPNGSGKSTLLQVVAGALMPTAGQVEHTLQGRPVEQDEVYRHISIAAPYLGLYEDLSLREAIDMHARFKPLRNALTPDGVAEIAYLGSSLEKPVRNFSSGMKQRLKLALAILSDSQLLLLDEPGSNLDTRGVEWFRSLLNEHLGTRTLLVASNRQAEETFACNAMIDVERFKRTR